MSESRGVFHCEFAGVPKGPRYEMWREEFARRWLSSDFDPIDRDHFVNEVNTTEHSMLGLCRMRSTPVRIRRREDATSRAPGLRYLIVASGSPLQAAQRGRSIDLSPGQMTLLSGDEPAEVVQSAVGDRWSVRLPADVLDSVCRKVDDLIACPIEPSREPARFLLQQFETAHRFASKLGASMDRAVGQHLLDLVSLCLGATGEFARLAARRGLASARLDAVKAQILRQLVDPNMRLQRIAASHDLSTRYVQYLFGLEGTSFTAYVLEQRLLLAHRLLRTPATQWRKVSDIATNAGFSDISYFNRAFKTRFAATPSDIRGRVE